MKSIDHTSSGRVALSVFFTVHSTYDAFGPFAAEQQSLLLIEAVYALVVNFPALSTE
jgi:hypothetical protein